MSSQHAHAQYVHISRTKPLYTLEMIQLVYHSYWHSKPNQSQEVRGLKEIWKTSQRTSLWGFFCEVGREGLGQAYLEDFEV